MFHEYAELLHYNGNPETVHYLNWLHHSGEVDLDSLIEQAEIESREMGDETPEHSLAFSLHHKLVHILHYELDHIFTDEALTFNEFMKDQDYIGPVRDKLVAPLLGLMMGRIDCDAIAQYILASEGVSECRVPEDEGSLDCMERDHSPVCDSRARLTGLTGLPGVPFL
jgi:hypothetical protein